MKQIRQDMSFPHTYEIEQIGYLPSTLGKLTHLYFPGAKTEGGKDGILIKVFPNLSNPWIGTFAFGYNSPKVITGVFSCPNKQYLCVVSSGQGYFVNVNSPHLWDEVQSYPVFDVRIIIEKSLLLFVDFSTISAYGLYGLRWVTSQLSWDGIKITEITASHIKGLAWDAPQQQEVEFWVDIQTGNHEGGASPEN